jgi:hypothetical protein
MNCNPNCNPLDGDPLVGRFSAWSHQDEQTRPQEMRHTRTMIELAAVQRSIAEAVEQTEERAAEADRLRERVLQHLRDQGFRVRDGAVVAPVDSDKERLRSLHGHAVEVQRERARGALQRHEEAFVQRLLRGDALDPAQIRPKLLLVENRRSLDGLLWRWSALHWSIPVSSGYGRRLRFLVVDEGHNDSVIGLIGLADPVFALGCRDQAIGWTAEQRRTRLACVMDAFVLGALPPYRDLCGGKLVALLAMSTEVRDVFAAKYGHRTTLIADRDPNAQLAMITTTSALGRSSVYNRLVYPDGGLAFQPVGYTRGSGDFQDRVTAMSQS